VALPLAAKHAVKKGARRDVRSVGKKKLEPRGKHGDGLATNPSPASPGQGSERRSPRSLVAPPARKAETWILTRAVIVVAKNLHQRNNPSSRVFSELSQRTRMVTFVSSFDFFSTLSFDIICDNLKCPGICMIDDCMKERRITGVFCLFVQNGQHLVKTVK
jgi:hypothetical protein